MQSQSRLDLHQTFAATDPCSVPLNSMADSSHEFDCWSAQFARTRVIRVSSDPRPSRIASPGQSAVPLLT
jgi:hypothetical protein